MAGLSPAAAPARAGELAAALERVEQRVARACAAAGRARGDVTVVAVSKTWPASDVAALAALGVRDFGESKDQEAAGKAAALPELTWHFVGRLQRNKARSVASYADVVHSVDRPPLVEALSAGALRAGRALAVLLQVSLDGDPERGGVAPEDVVALGDAVAAAPGLVLRGVMAVAPRDGDPAPAFARLAACGQRLAAAHPGATAVSAGMSGDLEQAVAHGATHLRIGGALFGQRPPLRR